MIKCALLTIIYICVCRDLKSMSFSEFLKSLDSEEQPMCIFGNVDTPTTRGYRL